MVGCAPVCAEMTAEPERADEPIARQARLVSMSDVSQAQDGGGELQNAEQV